ncbi:MAG: hypothetical protein HQK60_19960 [Deltaproteobacteria bacterium]|nr:hypothetical protein [Deltaproteobacteria bacterium]
MEAYAIKKKFVLSILVGALFLIAMVLAPQTGIAAGPVKPQVNGPASLYDFFKHVKDTKQSGTEGTSKYAPKSGPRASKPFQGRTQGDDCTAVLDDHFYLYIPIIDIGSDYFWLEVQYQDNGYFLYTGSDFQDPSGFTACDHAYLTDASDIYVPLMYFVDDGNFYWLQLTYLGCDDTGCWFQMTDAGLINY